MKKIKIMHFVSGLAFGGVEQMLYNYCKFMSNEKYEFVIVYQHEAIKECEEKFREIGVRTYRISARSESFVKNITDSIEILKKENPDIVHAHMNLMNFCALYAAKRAKVKNRISHSHIAEVGNGIIKRVVFSIFKMLCRVTATNYLACGYDAGVYLYGKKMMENNSVNIITNAIDLKYYERNENERLEFRKKYSLENNLVIGHIGRFTEQKNHKKVVDIFNRIHRKCDSARLVLVGNGYLENDIKSYVNELGIAEYVLFVGSISEMRGVYSAFDGFVLPSLYEGLPVVSIEVQAARIPSVFSTTIDKSCKMTDYIKFVYLEEDDESWAEIVLEEIKRTHNTDIYELEKSYDIRYKKYELEEFYDKVVEVGSERKYGNQT